MALMLTAPGPLAATEPPRAGRLPPTLTRMRLGMPHLGPFGLSETWLLKELGHLHWLLLARHAGKDWPDFRDGDGGPVYAAFCAVSVRDADLGIVADGSDLLVSSELGHISRSQVGSRHEVAVAGHPVATVEFCSTFVRRSRSGSNHAIARVPQDGMVLMQADTGLRHTAGLAAAMRAGQWDEHGGFARKAAGPHGTLRIRPCPAQDFNGAGFLYCASFQAFVDRAEWELLDPEPVLVTRSRDVFFYGNVEIGEALEVTVASVRSGEGLAHWCRLSRCGDGAFIADVFTDKRAAT